MLARLLNGCRAFLRGEKRVHKGNRGRVYARRSDLRAVKAQERDVKKSGSKPRVTMTYRVYRAATGRWDDPVTVPAKKR